MRSSGMSSHVVLRSGSTIEIFALKVPQNKKRKSEEKYFDRKNVVSIHGHVAWTQWIERQNFFVNEFTRQLKPECVMCRLRTAAIDSANCKCQTKKVTTNTPCRHHHTTTTYDVGQRATYNDDDADDDEKYIAFNTEFRIPVEMNERKIKSLTMREKLDVLVKHLHAKTCNVCKRATIHTVWGHSTWTLNVLKFYQ